MALGYVGKYGQLKVLSTEFLSLKFMEELEQKWDDFIKILSGTTYRREVDEFSALYKIPDLIDVVLNAHMMRTMQSAAFAAPPEARSFITAYLSKWDIENIKLILSAKVLGYTVEQTEKFLVVQHDTPAGILAGIITKDDYKTMLAQKDVEGVVNSVLKYGYGKVLLKYLDSAKRNSDISEMVLALDLYYYNVLIEEYKLHNITERIIGEYIAESIDVRNIMNMLKGLSYGYKNLGQYVIKGGNIGEKELTEIASKGAEYMLDHIPFKINDAIERYKSEGFLGYIENALRRELYKKYISEFRHSSFSLAFIFAYMLRGEMERDELRNIWFSRYYNISKDRSSALKIAKYVLSEN